MSKNVKVLSDSGNYTIVRNTVLNDKTLTWKAKGILAFMLSVPDTWDYSIAGLARCAADGEASIKAAFAELKSSGYLEIVREQGENGKFAGCQYVVRDTPQVEKPQVEKPQVEKPQVENHRQTNTNITNYQTNQLPKETNGAAAPMTRNWTDAILTGYCGGNASLREALDSWVECRRKLRNVPFTEKALSLNLVRLTKLSNSNDKEAEKIVNQAVANGWRSFYHLRDYGRKKSVQEWADVWEDVDDKSTPQGSNGDGYAF